MTFPSLHHSFLAITPAILLLGLSACSSGNEATAETGPESADPPGAALPLSIGGAAESEAEGDFELAVNCAAAVDLTAERLAQMSSNPRSREIALLGRAQDHFEARAEEARASAAELSGSTAAAIARRRNEKSKETSEQAQLAIACLRRFGNEVSAETGAQVTL